MVRKSKKIHIYIFNIYIYNMYINTFIREREVWVKLSFIPFYLMVLI